MKKHFLLAVLLFLPASPALAGVSCTLPFTLTNGTPADATQVMANYNALVTCLGNAATAGINSDITALTGLTTPVAPVQGGTSSFGGGTSSGTNAITVSATVPANFTLTVNYKVRFIAGGANSGATTLTVGPTLAQPFNRQTPYGVVPMVGGEIVAGQVVEAVWDGTQYQLLSLPALGHAPGEVFDVAGGSCPAGSLETNGDGTVSQTAFPTLFALIGTLWGAAAGGNFTIPDLRGRATFGRDPTVSRISAAGGNFNGNVVGSVGGQQNKVVGQSNLSNFSLPLSVTNGTLILAGGNAAACNSSTGACTSGGTPAYAATTTASVVGLSTASSVTVTGTSGGSGTPLPTLSNAAIVFKCIKG